jgi:hypothetical protein
MSKFLSLKFYALKSSSTNGHELKDGKTGKNLKNSGEKLKMTMLQRTIWSITRHQRPFLHKKGLARGKRHSVYGGPKRNFECRLTNQQIHLRDHHHNFSLSTEGQFSSGSPFSSLVDFNFQIFIFPFANWHMQSKN